MEAYFTDYFRVSERVLDQYGAFNISLVTDLPLFIDPFLLFNSDKAEYQTLHKNIIKYLTFLRDQSESGRITKGLLGAWFYFHEVKQNWLGFCEEGNSGRGLSTDFAVALNNNLFKLFRDFGKERITRGHHLEKLCLVKDGVGKDSISDFTTNLIKEYLLEYTQTFAKEHISPKLTKEIAVDKVSFNYYSQTWQPKNYTLPIYNQDYVLLTPKDMLTKDDIWISKGDFFDSFSQIPKAIPNEQLRDQINNYFMSILPKEPKVEDYHKAVNAAVMRFPILVDYFIKGKEDNGHIATERSIDRVLESKSLYIEQYGYLIRFLFANTPFYTIIGDTAQEARQRILYLKDVIENKGGWRALYIGDKPIGRERDLHILYQLTWYGTVSDVSHEVNDGRGPADFKISRGAEDKTIVEFKLASNPQLERNLLNQVEIYKRSSHAHTGYKVIFYFFAEELKRVQDILQKLHLSTDENIILIDARKDNKPSASQAIIFS